MRIAIANWGGRVSPVLDTAASLTVIDLESGAELGRQAVRLAGSGMCERARQIGELGPNVLICGAVSRPLHDLLWARGIEVVPFVTGDVDSVLAAFVRRELPSPELTMPGCGCLWRGAAVRGGARWCHGRGWGALRPPGAGGAGRGPSCPRAAALTPAGGVAAKKGGLPMVVVVSARGEGAEAPVDFRFGRAPFFIAVDIATGAMQAHSNRPGLESAEGAGIQAAQFVAGLGAGAVVSGNVGPKAFRVLQAAGVRVYRCEGATVTEAIRRFQAGELPEVTSPTVPGHWA